MVQKIKRAKKPVIKRNKIKKEYLHFYDLLTDLIKTYGEWEVKGNQLSKEWNIPNSTIYRWRDAIVEDIGLLDISRFGSNVQKAMTSNLQYCQKLIRTAESPRDKISALSVFNQMIKGTTEFLENYGYKEKIAEKIAITENNISYKDFAQAYEQYKENK